MDRKRLKDQLVYLWSDYKWPLLAGAIVCLVAVYMLIHALTQKETVLSVMLIDCHAAISQEEMEKDALAALGCKDGKQQAEILTSLLFSEAGSGSYAMTSLSRFYTEIGSEKVDIAGMLKEDFLNYEDSGTWLDLTGVLDEELSERLKEALVIQDNRVIGIETAALPVLTTYGCYEGAGEKGVLGVLYNAPHRENAAAYIRYLAGLTAQED